MDTALGLHGSCPTAGPRILAQLDRACAGAAETSDKRENLNTYHRIVQNSLGGT